MDVDTDIEASMQLLNAQKEMLLRARKRKGERPRDRESRSATVQKFMIMHASMTLKENRTQGTLLRQAFIPPAYLPCTTPIARLKHIAIKQLQLETHHRGMYVLLRAVTPPCRMTGILVIGEDGDGDVVLLQMYNQEGGGREITDIVDIGAVVLVKEPYFKITASGDYAIRVDHVSDVVRLNANDAMLPARWSPRLAEIHDSIEPLKAKGDAAMGKQKWWQAISEYSDAITFGGDADRIEVIRRNRSLAYLKTKQYDAALLDTNYPDFGPEPAEKALFRAAEALYRLRRYAESVNVLETLCARFPNNAEASSSLDRARVRYDEEQSGQYDFKVLQRQAKQLRPPQLDHATFVGPVEVKQAANKGRGLFVTKAVRAGDLLLCEKALAYAYAPEPGEKETGNSQVSLLMNIETETGFMGGQADLIRIIAQKLYLNPSLAPAFTTLYHGKYSATEVTSVDGKPVVDSFLIERTMALNVFGCPSSSIATHVRSMNEESFDEKQYHSCGIWPHASMINHSCMANARRSFIGDMMLVRATQDLVPGDEVTFWYRQLAFNESGRAKLDNWGFECDCSLCADGKQTKATTRKERRKLQAAVQKEFSSQKFSLNKIERLISQLETTYHASRDRVPRLRFWDAQMQVARIYRARENPAQAFKSACRMLGFLGFALDESKDGFEVKKWGLVIDYLIEAFIFIAEALTKLKAMASAEKAKEYARTVYKIVVGEEETFEKTYGGWKI